MKTQTINRREAIKAGLAGLTLVIAGCGDQKIKSEKIEFEDYLINYDGISVFHTDPETKELVENRYRRVYSGKIKIYKDLNETSTRFVEVETIYKSGCGEYYDVIAHLRTSDRVKGGDDSSGGKHPVHYRRLEAEDEE